MPKPSTKPAQRKGQPDEFVLLRPEQLRAIESAVRQRILDVLAASGPYTVAAIADALGRRPDGLYHHIRELERVDLVRRAGSSATGGRNGDVYAARARMLKLPTQGLSPEGRESLGRITTSLLRLTEKDVNEAFASGAAKLEGEERNLLVGRSECVLSPEDLIELIRRMKALERWLSGKSREGRGQRLALTQALVPLASSPGAEQVEQRRRSGTRSRPKHHDSQSRRLKQAATRR